MQVRTVFKQKDKIILENPQKTLNNSNSNSRRITM